MMNTLDILHKAIDTYGKKHQTMIFFEEVAELEKELSKNIRGESNREAITEEIADVEIMLEQIKKIYDIPESQIELMKHKKLKRLAKRLGMNEVEECQE